MVYLLNESLIFPDPALADEDGWLAVGGDLSPQRLILAYRNGIFPWYSEGDPICWYSPHQRFVIKPEELHISHSMQSLIRKNTYEVTENKCFTEVITNCATINREGQSGTWITVDMKAAYIRLHEMGVAHSIEIWHEGKLVGGIYGVVISRAFCGESMFSLMPSASKLALTHLCQSGRYDLIDCQMHTPHLKSMGGRYMSRDEFTAYLSRSEA